MMKWTKVDLENKVSEIVADIYGENPGQTELRKVPLDADIRMRLGFDSIMLVILQITLEDTFHIRFDPVKDDFREIFSTVGTICSYVENSLGAEE